jgi:hypothetical protein
MSTSADRVGEPMTPIAQEAAAGPLIDQGPGHGSDVQRRGARAEATSALPPPAGVTDQSPGPLTPDVVYLGEPMLYTKDIRSPESLDPLENAGYLRRLLLHAILVALVWGLGSIATFALGAIVFFGFNFISLVTGILLTAAWWIIMACVFWLRKLQRQVAGWNFLIGDKAELAPLTFTHIVWAFNRRGTPVDSCRVRRFSAPGQGQREVLEVRNGIFYSLVSCFASGDDLYIGWTYWLCLSPARWLMLWLRRFLWGTRLYDHAVDSSLRADRAEALRAALHRVVQEGVEVAMGKLAAQGEGTIGTVVPVVGRKRGPNWRRLLPLSFTPAAGSVSEQRRPG